ncbi:PilC/PilY family type IV pilus protein [Thiocystis violacea]|uniref:PilC/PilY family type IV pilus protein n=1 Tax=Thiocystis violacea TaxID=13725 RepID=UPI00190816D2|nr:PilC/PilY family type IV pilus protein [Thiocystis violacea]
MKISILSREPGSGFRSLLRCIGLAVVAFSSSVFAEPAQFPLFMGGDITAAPLTMLVMGRDHTLYYEAYNDASDLNDDGLLDVGYKPDDIDYFGYFDSNLCYTYNSGEGRFEPSNAAASKKCSGSSGRWSGDFLNYVTTARIDALRKVLYGGHRIVDEGGEGDDCLPNDCITVLERSYIPQDAHSWGKEYQSVLKDGYEISDYTPLSAPSNGSRHLFANTTLLKSGNKEPLMRVLQNSKYRIWEWVAIERPVAGEKCLHGGNGPACVTSGGDIWEVVPASALDLTQTVYKKSGSSPGSKAAFDTLVTTYATTANLCGSQAVNTINGSGNPFAGVNGCTSDNYLNLFEGTITIKTAGTYTFSIDGDDAVDLRIDGLDRVGWSWYGGHGNCNCNTHSDSIYLTEGTHSLRFRHEEATGGDNYYLRWKVSIPASTLTDYTVRVKVCDPSFSSPNCKAYPDGPQKPVGLLHRYGETDEMLFGLISGSFKHPTNMRGGVLRKNIESFKDEVDLSSGVFTDTLGIVRTIDRFRIVDFNKDKSYEYQGGWLTTAPMVDSTSQFPDWGNPIGEMLYESLRYFSGKDGPTHEFMPTLTSGKERVTLRDYYGSSTMDLPAPNWVDPYTRDEGAALYCSPGAQLVISDVNPSYDTTYVPGTAFDGASFGGGDISGLNVSSEANTIWNAEHGGSSLHFIGQVGDDYDGAPSAKIVSGFGNIRGLSPSEPTKQGGYYSAAIAHYAFEHDLRADIEDKQDVNTFAVALASPLPRIDIPVGARRVTLVPFAKSVGGNSINVSEGAFQPTNSIVDFFIETFANTDPLGSDADPDINDGRALVRFRINFEDVEQGADHDMDAIVVYEAKVNEDGTLTVQLTSEYAAGGIIQHMGYAISGTTKDGVYLEVRDSDTGEGSDPDYFLDTHAGLDSGACAGASPASACDNPLPLLATRTFEVSSGSDVATVLENPLWYAAKYGSEGNERLAAGETSPNYFLVTNAGTLQKQLETAFESMILLGKSSASAISVDSVRIDSETLAFLANFDSSDWSGTLVASNVGADGKLTTEVWNTDTVALPAPDDRAIFTFYPGNADTDPAGIAFDWSSLSAAQKSSLGADATEQANVLAWLRGDTSLEGPGDADFREREKMLGDIVNSNPVYDDTTGTLYVGANDGMLHAFDVADGTETFAYIPNALFPTLRNLTSQGYIHRYYVDGSATIGETSDRSILIGTLGAGGRAVFALDVTDPEHFAAEDVLWEISETTQPVDNLAFDGPDYAELGYMIGQMSPTPAIGYWKGQWVAVFGNGFDSGTGATLFVVNAATGMLVDKLTVSTETDNGLAGAALVLDSDKHIAGAYAGDLKGNLWKFDFTGSALALASNGAPLFVAQDVDGNRQPITAAVNFTKHPDGGNIVVFGTGQYMRSTDPTNLTGQTAYGIWDNAKLQTASGNLSWSGGSATYRGALLKQEFLYEDVIGDRKWRVVSNNSISWATHRGWYVDLISPVDGAQGERINYQAGIIPGSGEAVFTSIVPTASDDPCMAGTAYRWIFILDSLTGGISDWTRFDVNEDGVFDIDDVKKITDPDNPDATSLVPYIGFTTDFGGAVSSGGSGTDVILLNERKLPGGPPRQSWRQLR